MGKETEDTQSIQLYSKLSADQQASLAEAILQRLKSMIGGYGELSVLSEYISVMLQSTRPADQIQSELEAFLQEQSAPFTAWLCEQVTKLASEAPPAEEGTGGKRRRREKRAEREAADKPVEADAPEKKKSKREKKNGSVLAAAAAAAAGAAPLRSRSRKRRRRNSVDVDAADGAEAGTGTSAGSREPAARKATLTPNVEYLREAYHTPKADSHSSADGKDTRWSFRADGPPSQGAAPQATPGPPPAAHHYPPPQHYYPPLHSPHQYHYAAPGAMHPAPAVNASPANGVFAGAPTAAASVPASRPARFIEKKWRVLRPNTVVRASEKLDSAEVQKLQVGEIVEQVAPAFTTEKGLIRIQIRHPSSSVFPNPIGWVTQDATAAGGPKFLEQGPEPMQKSPSNNWRPPASSWASSAWRPRGSAGPWSARPAAAPAAPQGRPSFQNLTWKPSADKAPAD